MECRQVRPGSRRRALKPPLADGRRGGTATSARIPTAGVSSYQKYPAGWALDQWGQGARVMRTILGPGHGSSRVCGIRRLAAGPTPPASPRRSPRPGPSPPSRREAAPPPVLSGTVRGPDVSPSRVRASSMDRWAPAGPAAVTNGRRGPLPATSRRRARLRPRFCKVSWGAHSTKSSLDRLWR
jgi:hypothetical protein